MKAILNIPDCPKKKRVVIIGGGFAGLQIAKKIDLKHYQVLLLDKVNYYQFQPLMYQVATAGLEPSSISYPHRKAFQKRRDLHFRTCKALKVDPTQNLLETSIGEVHYDYLVIATGCDTNYFGNDALKETTFALKSVPEAILMRNRILMSFEQALNEKSAERLSELLTFVIVGGGATGVELAGALADMKKSILPKDYPELDFAKMQIHLVDASPRLLAAMSENASENVARILSKRGVIIHHDMPVKSYDGRYVEMNDGSRLASRNVFWVGGVKPNSLAGLAETSYIKGRLAVDEYNRVVGYENIFSIGDTSLMTAEAKWPKGHPQLAQVALQMAKNLARNLNRKAKGNAKVRRFAYCDKGSLATIGRNAAVADLGRFRFSGIVAWWLWLVVHIFSIVGMKNRLAVLTDWAWNYLTYDVPLRLLITPKFSKIYDAKIE
ncbi:NAD(P)/FAD-dependent oxidoreductase [uncultured Alistipes sp.]|jgi:hypothetical protein|uniref:NAD(P)/FAD-dependent oxidoreductase n=1 Tax=uncultured Alistipes sp. TaxID=538949 RepID=UPI0025DC2C32|nr:NAD(P)/FAD-dependent oxidoreductase [uncultured Alistipes sp.]